MAFARDRGGKQGGLPTEEQRQGTYCTNHVALKRTCNTSHRPHASNKSRQNLTNIRRLQLLKSGRSLRSNGALTISSGRFRYNTSGRTIDKNDTASPPLSVSQFLNKARGVVFILSTPPASRQYLRQSKKGPRSLQSTPHHTANPPLSPCFEGNEDLPAGKAQAGRLGGPPPPRLPPVSHQRGLDGPGGEGLP